MCFCTSSCCLSRTMFRSSSGHAVDVFMHLILSMLCTWACTVRAQEQPRAVECFQTLETDRYRSSAEILVPVLVYMYTQPSLSLASNLKQEHVALHHRVGTYNVSLRQPSGAVCRDLTSRLGIMPLSFSGLSLTRYSSFRGQHLPVCAPCCTWQGGQQTRIVYALTTHKCSQQ
jgi:hypothetical protein